MKSLRCSNCGGALALDASGLKAVCRHCGGEFLLDHEDTDYYHDFFAQMTAFLSQPKNEQERKQQAEEFWNKAHTKTFIRADDTPIEVNYMYTYSERDADVYVARRNIIFHFKEQGAEKIERFRKAISLLDYPSADTRHLEDFFPKITGGFVLNDGSHICVISKNEDEYPLSLFGVLPGRHVAWIVSRIENLCCVLEFSSLVHPFINSDTLYINPYTHQAALYGNWWHAGKSNSLDNSSRTPLRLRENLLGLRETAASLLGYSNRAQVKATDDVPVDFATFIQSTPCATAYDDFDFWDTMMIKAYGERKFIKFDTNDSDIYTTKG